MSPVHTVVVRGGRHDSSMVKNADRKACLALIVKVDAVTGHFRTQPRGTGTDPEPLALDRPAIALIGILAEMGFIDIDQGVLATRGGDQQGVEFFQKRRALVRIRFIQ